MYQLFVFTASRKKAVEDFHKTIRNPVPDNLIVRFLGHDFLKELKRQNPTGPIYAWGATPKPNNIRVWNAMEVGDYVVAYQRGKLVGLFRIIGKAHNEEFAKNLWGIGEDPDDLGMTWEYMYFLQKITDLDIPSPVLFRGHTRLQKSRSKVEKAIQDALGRSLEEIDAETKIVRIIRKPKRLRRPRKALSFALKVLDKIERGDFYVPDTWTRAKVRIGQSVLREVVLWSYDYKCCICRLDIPELLDIAHIKAWAEDPYNRLNPENCLPLCSLHHRAYDRAYLRIENKKVVITEKARLFSSRVVSDFLLAYDGAPIMEPVHDYHDIINKLKAELQR